MCACVCYQYLHSLMALQQQNSPSPNTSAERLQNVEMSLEALRNAIKNNPGLYQKHQGLYHKQPGFVSKTTGLYE